MTDTHTATMRRPSNDKRARKPVDPNESKADAFVRLSLQRMPKFLKAGRQLCYLAKYPHSEQQRARIVEEVHKVADEVEAAFTQRDKSRRDSFSF